MPVIKDDASDASHLVDERASTYRLLEPVSHPSRAEDLVDLHRLQKSSTKPRQDDVNQKHIDSLSETLKSSARVAGPKVVRGESKAAQKPPTGPAFAFTRSGFIRAMSDAGLKPTVVHHNLTPAELYEQALQYEGGTHIVACGALATLSGAKTGRSPRDKRVVREPASQDDIWWAAADGQPANGSPNYEMDEKTFILNRERAVDYLNMLERIYVFDGFAGWDPESRIKVRVVCARAYHALFMYNMLIRPTEKELAEFGKPDFTIFNAGAFPVNRYTSYMSSSTSVDINLRTKEMVILGTQYAGEMKKGIFSVMHYLMPKRGILSLHSGCNVGAQEDVTLFFGLSGTGKTTLSTDPARPLIGDDEHCWSNNGVFNIEGGCYAKCIGLKKSSEPEIYNAIRFGSVLENVVFDEHTREVDFDSNAVTENTRASYPIDYIPNARIPCLGPHPKNLILLCCDAFGVLPPVSRLTKEQAMYHFISGYTAKVAGTEMGVTEPEATFSACFGGAFLMWHPMKYAAMLAHKMEQHGTSAWLVNTGWTGGRYGVGSRIKLRYTRAIIDAIHSGELAAAKTTTTPIFSLHVPNTCTAVPDEILNPANQWANKAEFDKTLGHLATLYQDNFKKYGDGAGFVSVDLAKSIVSAGPKAPTNGHA
ncbi:Phosphoenolpyruvate carboxykinase (ATP) [Coccomyxa sp. Obi]|nr:Phosphoenolpyruvate carboxykinase (ATP) [Coccomyxa sp. Obi]